MLKACKKHGDQHHFLRKDTNSWRCGKCASEWVVTYRIRKKEKLVATFGGQCIICGYSRYAGALDFHHRDATEKSFAISDKLTRSWDRVMEEAKKCVLLCKNCHQEVEADVVQIPMSSNW